MNKKRIIGLAVAVAASASMVLSGLAPASAATPSVTDFCPTVPTKVGYAKGSNNLWTKTVLAELKLEAAKCKNITDVIFTDAGGDPQKSISDFNGLVAQGVKVIIAQPEAGPVMLPAIKAATAAGVKVVNFISTPGGSAPADYVAFINHDVKYIGEQQAAFFNRALKGKGKIAFLGGVPGAASSITFFNAFRTALKKYPGLKLVENNFIVTNWDPGQKKKVMTALLSKYGYIDGVVSDYTTTDTGVIDAYTAAKQKLPALAGQASANVNAQQWKKKNFPFFSLDATTTPVKRALRFALAALAGKTTNEPALGKLRTYIDTTTKKNPKFYADLPLGADASSSLTLSQLKEAIK